MVELSETVQYANSKIDFDLSIQNQFMSDMVKPVYSHNSFWGI